MDDLAFVQRRSKGFGAGCRSTSESASRASKSQCWSCLLHEGIWGAATVAWSSPPIMLGWIEAWCNSACCTRTPSVRNYVLHAWHQRSMQELNNPWVAILNWVYQVTHVIRKLANAQCWCILSQYVRRTVRSSCLAPCRWSPCLSQFDRLLIYGKACLAIAIFTPWPRTHQSTSHSWIIIIDDFIDLQCNEVGAKVRSGAFQDVTLLKDVLLDICVGKERAHKYLGER